MRYLALLAAYVLVAALVLPSSISAQDEPAPGDATTPAKPAAPEPPAPSPGPGPGTPAPAPAQAQPPEPAPPASEPTPPASAPAEAAPEPRALGEEPAKPRARKPKALAAASGSVTIADFDFAPASITINQGDTVTWNNDGPTPHSAKANDGSFDTGILKKGQSGSHTFQAAGTFSYFCQPHPFMKATVVVQAAQSGGGSGSGAGTSGAGGSSGGSGGAGAEASQSEDGGPALPDTGADSGALLLLGALMLLLGIGMHRRAAA